jgi:hypothetical protein
MTYSPEELQEMIAKMQSASSVFYSMAVRSGNHAFIEFTGFMNEYINLCQAALAEGRDFTEANVHVGQPLFPMRPHHANYLGEKFGCIFASSFHGDETLIEAFKQAAFK